jgi:hypothetical protein
MSMMAEQIKGAASLIERVLLPLARQRFRLNGLDPAQSPHGENHWVSVWGNALTLASLANRPVDLNAIAVFCFCHDMERQDEFDDPGHGKRAAKVLAGYKGNMVEWGVLGESVEPLLTAVELHDTGARADHDLDTAIMYDADRIDLDRFGIQLRKELMSTPHGQSLAVGGPAVWDMFRRFGQ